MNGVGICSKRGGAAFQFEKHKIESILNDFKNLKVEQLKQEYIPKTSYRPILCQNRIFHFTRLENPSFPCNFAAISRGSASG
jgi:hypothetical protein